MIRQPEIEQLHRLSVKTLDQVFITRAQEGLSCSLFEAQALTDLVREVYFPWLAQPNTPKSLDKKRYLYRQRFLFEILGLRFLAACIRS